MTSSDFQPLPGMSDLGVPEISTWQRMEEKARQVLALYGFTEVRTPVLEPTSVFVRSLGDTTDVVQKEMYTFEDRGGRSVSLRPEGTASIIRYAAGLGQEAADGRFYYMGPMFRCERPQAGRKRQFHQFGVEALGAASPAADVEVIALQQHVFSAWGLKASSVELNTRGLPEDRRAVVEGLTQALKPHMGELCEDCRRRYESNILRVLDCKQEACGKVVDALPPMTSFMSDASRKYIDDVLRLLEQLNIPARINPRLVRGLDYYVHTVWENRHPALGAQDAISGGGRYQIEVAGKLIDGVGFAVGMERVVTALQHDMGGVLEGASGPVIWIVSQGDRALAENMVLAQTLRLRGVACGIDVHARSLKSQMRQANRAGSAYAVIRGDLELEKGLLVLKNMKDGSQAEMSLAELVERLHAVGGTEVLKS